MKGYFHYEPSAAYPLGHLGKMKNMQAWLYDPVHDRWDRWEYGDAMLWGQGPWDSCDSISDEDGDYLKFRLQVAEALTHMFGNNYLDGRNFVHVIEGDKYIRELYDEGETPWGAAALSGYCCG